MNKTYAETDQTKYKQQSTLYLHSRTLYNNTLTSSAKCSICFQQHNRAEQRAWQRLTKISLLNIQRNVSNISVINSPILEML